jgi:hypothetical protein
MFTGTLIEDLIATVERAQQRTEAEAQEMAEIEPWFAELEVAACDAKLLGVA